MGSVGLLEQTHFRHTVIAVGPHLLGVQERFAAVLANLNLTLGLRRFRHRNRPRLYLSLLWFPFDDRFWDDRLFTDKGEVDDVTSGDVATTIAGGSTGS